MALRIGLDLDGTLAGFPERWTSLYQTWFAKNLPDEAWLEWDAHVTYTGFTKDEFWAWVDSVPRFWEDMPAIPGAQGGVLDLLKRNHTLEIITNRHPQARNATHNWLLDNWPKWGPLPQLHMVKGDKSVIDCQVYVDDNPRRIRELAKNQRRVIVFTQPWNESVAEVPGLVYHAASWADVVRLVDDLDENGGFTVPVPKPTGRGPLPAEQTFADEALLEGATS